MKSEKKKLNVEKRKIKLINKYIFFKKVKTSFARGRAGHGVVEFGAGDGVDEMHWEARERPCFGGLLHQEWWVGEGKWWVRGRGNGG